MAEWEGLWGQTLVSGEARVVLICPRSTALHRGTVSPSVRPSGHNPHTSKAMPLHTPHNRDYHRLHRPRTGLRAGQHGPRTTHRARGRPTPGGAPRSAPQTIGEHQEPTAKHQRPPGRMCYAAAPPPPGPPGTAQRARAIQKGGGVEGMCSFQIRPHYFCHSLTPPGKCGTFFFGIFSAVDWLPTPPGPPGTAQRARAIQKGGGGLEGTCGSLAAKQIVGGREAPDTGLAHAPVSRAYGHRYSPLSQCRTAAHTKPMPNVALRKN